MMYDVRMIIKETIKVSNGYIYIEADDNKPNEISIAQDESYPIQIKCDDWWKVIRAVEKVINVAGTLPTE